MISWWTSLSTDLQIFWAIGIVFLVITVLQLLLSLLGIGGEVADFDVGHEATVYVTLPGSDEDGGGQIQLTLQGRMRVASARKVSPGPASPGQKVRITGMFAETTFMVETIPNP